MNEIDEEKIKEDKIDKKQVDNNSNIPCSIIKKLRKSIHYFFKL